MEDENLENTPVEEQTSQKDGGTEEPVTLLDGQQEGESHKDYAERLMDEKAELDDKNKQLYARTKKPKPKAGTPDNSTQPDVKDISKFYSTGGTDEEYKVLETIMKGQDKTFSEAVKDDLFTTFREGEKAKKKASDAQLGASNGSPEAKKVNTSKMTEEEHKAHAQAVIQKEMNG